MILGFFRLLAYFFIALAVYIFLRILFPSRRAVRRDPKRASLTKTMVKDEVCNIYLPRDEAIRESWNGRDFFFCSPACREKFLEQHSAAGGPPVNSR
jgi:YHS domain-containing protein